MRERNLRPRYPVESALACLAILASLSLPSEAARARRMALDRHSLELPGPPASIVPTDLDGDGDRDLLVVVAYTEWDEIGMDRLEGLVQVTTVVPALFDRRQVHAFLWNDGAFEPAGEPLPLPFSVITVAAGPQALPAVALTDDGLAAVRLLPDGGGLTLDPLVVDPPVMAGGETYLPSLELVQDLDADGTGDIVHPGRDGPAVYVPEGGGLRLAQRMELPGDGVDSSSAAVSHTVRVYPFPTARDIDGDGLPDLLSSARGPGPGHDTEWWVRPGRGGGLFGPAVEVVLPGSDPVEIPFRRGPVVRTPRVSMVDDVDGDGRAEVVLRVETSNKSGMKATKKPRHLFRFFRLGEALRAGEEPYLELEVVGHTEDFEFEGLAMTSFQDLDADGRLDLVTVTIDFSILQVIRVLATKRLSVELEFHVYAQQDDGTFEEVPDLDLTEKLRFDLNDLTLGRFAQFAGDFDGDGLVDFVHLGRGRKVTVHRGRAGCRYPKKPDLAMELDHELEDLAQVRIVDVDGDGRSDLLVARALSPEEAGVTEKVVLDLYIAEDAP